MNKQIKRRTNSRAGIADPEVAILILALMFASGIGILFAANMAGSEADQKVRQEAVDAGVAEWTIDKDGTKGFKWLSPGKESPSVSGK